MGMPTPMLSPTLQTATTTPSGSRPQTASVTTRGARSPHALSLPAEPRPLHSNWPRTMPSLAPTHSVSAPPTHPSPGNVHVEVDSGLRHTSSYTAPVTHSIVSTPQSSAATTPPPSPSYSPPRRGRKSYSTSYKHPVLGHDLSLARRHLPPCPCLTSLLSLISLSDGECFCASCFEHMTLVDFIGLFTLTYTLLLLTCGHPVLRASHYLIRGHPTYEYNARSLTVVVHATTGPCFRLSSREYKSV